MAAVDNLTRRDRNATRSERAFDFQDVRLLRRPSEEPNTRCSDLDGRCPENLVDRAPQRLVELGAGHLVGQIINQAQRSYSITGANANGSRQSV